MASSPSLGPLNGNSSTSRHRAVIPPLLESYLRLPPAGNADSDSNGRLAGEEAAGEGEGRLTLVTSVIGATSNWLVLRFLSAGLEGSIAGIGLQRGQDNAADLDDGNAVVLVSFMRDLAFWREGAKRLGIDLNKLSSRGKFEFVDGLSRLSLPAAVPVPHVQQQTSARKAVPTLLSSFHLNSISKSISESIRKIKGPEESERKVTLIIDQLDFLLAAGGEEIDAVGLGEMVLGLREDVYTTVLTISADYPLVAAKQSPLEMKHAEFILSVAHQADCIMGLRLLDTGAAKDVSGVVRVAIHPGAMGAMSSRIEREREMLYFVGGDGAVRVFERGQ